MFQGNVRHLSQIFVEHRRQRFRLQALGGGGEILDVGEEDRQTLALGMDDHVLLPAEDAFVDLRREIARNLQGTAGQKLVCRFQIPVGAMDRARLLPLEENEADADDGNEQKIAEQVFEGEDVARIGLPDDDLLNAAHIAHFPIGLRAFGMAIVAGNTGLAHVV